MSRSMTNSAAVAPNPKLLLADRLPAILRSNVAIVLLGAATVGLFAQIDWHVKGWPVPFTGQTLAVLLVAAAAGEQPADRAHVAAQCHGAVGSVYFDVP